MSNTPVYLDYAAATPLDERVLAAMRPFFNEQFYNPSSPYLAARQVKTAITEAKERIGHIIGAKPAEIIMTAGATESINLAISGIMKRFPKGKVLITAIEHTAVLSVAKQFNHEILPVNHDGLLDIDQFKGQLTDDVVLVSVGYANNEIGTIQPLKDISMAIESVRQNRLSRGDKTPLYLHTDASQAAGYLDIQTSRLGVDLMTLNAAKCYGPKQSGLLWVRSGIILEPIIYGGGQESGLRSGSENTANIVGFAKALEVVDGRRKQEVIRVGALRDKLQELILAGLPETHVGGSKNKRLANNLHLAFDGLDGERLVFGLEERGVLVATGSACAANKGTRSHVLTAIGMSDSLADGSLRLTLGHMTTEEDIKLAASAIIQTVKQEKEL